MFTSLFFFQWFNQVESLKDDICQSHFIPVICNILNNYWCELAINLISSSEFIIIILSLFMLSWDISPILCCWFVSRLLQPWHHKRSKRSCSRRHSASSRHNHFRWSDAWLVYLFLKIARTSGHACGIALRTSNKINNNNLIWSEWQKLKWTVFVRQLIR